MEELQCLNNVIPNLEMIKFQNIGLQKALLNKKMVLAFDTGTGKTFTYSLIVRALLNRNPRKKHIFIIIHDSIQQAPEDIRNLVEVPTIAVTAEKSSLSSMRSRWNNSSIIVMTYDCFRSMSTVRFLYDHLPEIESITIDEAHHAANWDDSDTAFMIRSLCHYIPYVYALSATPMTSSKFQFYQLLNIVDRSLSRLKDENYTGKYEEHYMPVNREDYNIKGSYKTTLKLVTPHPFQLGKVKGVLSRVMKGSGAVNQVNTLVRETKQRLKEGKSVIIYIHYHETREWVEEHLTREGVPFVSLHGRITNQEERRSILDAFSKGEVNVLITSVAESLNIDADVVIFYDFTTKIKQVMGRAHRGLTEKELELIFIITRDSAEVDFFQKYIYERSLTIQRILKKDYSEFIKVGEQLKQMQLEP